MFFAAASLGLPGLGNFVGEFLVLLGLYDVSPWAAAFAALGLITGAVYSLWMMQQTFQGEARHRETITDFTTRETSVMYAMMAALLVLGVYPQPVFDLVAPALKTLSGIVGSAFGGAL